MTSHKRLRELAEKATPGPWKTRYGRFYGDSIYVVESATGRVATASVNETNAEYLAACHPQQVVALLDEIDELNVACTKWREYFTGTPGLASANAEVVSLRQQLAAVSAARDELADIAERFHDDACEGTRDCKWDSTLSRITELRKAGSP